MHGQGARLAHATVGGQNGAVSAVIPWRRAKSAAVAKPSVKAPAKERWLALDLFRFAAVVLMIQGHVFYEVVSESVRGSWWYGYHGYVHGFTAPIFLFSSGMAFGITTLGKWDAHTHLGKTVYKRFERYLMIIGIGYAMHLQQLSLSWLLELPPERLARTTSVDALQHIGMVLIVAESLVMILRNKRLYLTVIAVLTGLAVFSAPFVWAADLSALPSPIAAWINDSTGSIFPIVPWCGFLFGGILTARFVQTRRLKAPGLRQLFLPLALIATALIFFGDRMAHASFDPFPEHNFWKTSPWFFFIRLGGVLGLLAVLCLVESLLTKRMKSTKKKMPVVRFVQVVGTQTLVLYVAHLMLLYGTGFTPGVNGSFHRGLDLLPAIGLVGLFFAAMGLLAYLWNWTKTHHFVWFERVRYTVTFAVIALILLT